MPDGWTGYDLAVESGQGLARVSIKTRSETASWKAGSWFIYDERVACDWLVFLFLPVNSPVRAWVVPFEIAREYGNKPLPARKDVTYRLQNLIVIRCHHTRITGAASMKGMAAT